MAAHQEEEHLLLEALRRAVDECEALEAIYGGAGCEEGEGDVGDAGAEESSSFRVVSAAELQKARDMLLLADEGVTGKAIARSNNENAPQLEVEIRVSPATTMRCRLPPGYPEVPAAVSVPAANGMRRAARDEVSRELNERAAELAGQEMVLDLVEYLKEMLSRHSESEDQVAGASESNTANDTRAAATLNHEQSSPSNWGRRWIWVHHITNGGRCKSIVAEARELGLGGYLKPGYPGVVVVEGSAAKCDEFVAFIKGNKSRPGGFGRNWGHHVRGHIDFDSDGDDGKDVEQSDHRGRRLPTEFQELEEDMATLSDKCNVCGLKDEFKEYVMQHKK